MQDPNIRRYRYSDRANVHHGVVVSQPGGKGPVIVYVPPIDEELPYERKLASWIEAEHFAQVVLELVGGTDTFVATRDHIDWWRANLTPAD